MWVDRKIKLIAANKSLILPAFRPGTAAPTSRVLPPDYPDGLKTGGVVSVRGDHGKMSYGNNRMIKRIEKMHAKQ